MRRRSASEMSFSVSCDRCGLEWSGRRPFAQPRNAASPRFIALLCGGRALAADGAAVAGGRELRRQTLVDYIDRARLLAAASATTSSSRSTSALWSTAPERALEFPAGVRDPLLRQPRHARLRPLPLADGRGRQPRLRRARSASGSAGRVHLGLGVRALRRTPTASSCARTTDEERASTRSWSRRTRDQALRLLGGPERRGAARARRRSRTRRTRRVLHTDASLPAAAARAPGRPGTTARRLRRFERPPDDHVLPEPAAAARGRAGLLRDAQPQRRDRTGVRDRAHRATSIPLYTLESIARPAGAAALSGAAPHGVRRRAPRQRLPRGRARLGRARGRAAGGGVVSSALYAGTLVHARRTPARERLPLPHLLLRARPRRAGRARAAAPALLGQPAERGRALRQATTSTATAARSRRRRSRFCAAHGVEGSSGSCMLAQLRFSATSSTRSASTGATGRTASSPA